MSTTRKPKGSYSRPTADWFTDKAAIAAGAFQIVGTTDVTIDLFNNAADGSNLHVWKVWVFNDAQGMYQLQPISGHGANFVGPAFSVIAGGWQPPGQIYQDSQAAPFSGSIVIPEGSPAGAYFLGGTDSESNSNVWPPGPFAVIPPGYSLRANSYISSGFSDHGLAVTFYYVVLPDRG